MKLLWQPVLLALAASLAGCATSRKPAVPPLTGDILVDAPRAIASGPARDRLIWQYRLAAAAMRQGKFDLAKQNLDEVLLTLGGIYGKDPDAKKARSYFRAEARKTFIGEPYERSMAYIYRGILYWMDGERDNARACFRSAEFEDSDAALQEYAGDWVLPDYLDGLATAKLGGDGSDAFQRAQANAKGIKLPPARPEANVLFFEKKGASETPWTKKLWIYDLRTNKHFTLKTNPLRRADLDEFVALYKASNRHGRQATWGIENPDGRWRAYSYDELIARDKTSLDIFWLKDDALADSDNLPPPGVIAQEIVDDLEAALDHFRLIAGDLQEQAIV